MGRALVTIGQLAELSGISASTLNHYLNKDLLQPARRSNGGYRLFDPDQAQEVLRRITSLKSAGNSLDEIKRMLRRRKR